MEVGKLVVTPLSSVDFQQMEGENHEPTEVMTIHKSRSPPQKRKQKQFMYTEETMEIKMSYP